MKRALRNDEYDRSTNDTTHQAKKPKKFSPERFNWNFSAAERAPCPEFKQPHCIGVFSLDEQRNLIRDYSALRYLSLPSPFKDELSVTKLNFDLHSGIDGAIKKDEKKIKEEGLGNMLRWILENPSLSQAEFVCFRGLLTVLFATPYEWKEGWIIHATRFAGTIYLWAVETEEKQKAKATESQRQKDMTSWGFKFEQYLCSTSPTEKPRTSEAVNENEELNVMISTKLGNHRLLYGAEIDCVDATAPVPEGSPWPFKTLRNFVELKTSRLIETERQEFNFRKFKCLKWWAQSFLVGIPRILCGFRDDDGMVEKLKMYDVMRLPKLAQEMASYGRGMWKANVCMNYCNDLLTFIKSILTEDDSLTVFEFKCLPGQASRIIVSPAPGARTLPNWFIQEMNTRNQSPSSYAK